MKQCPECGKDVPVRTWKYCSADCIKAVDIRRARARAMAEVTRQAEKQKEAEIAKEKELKRLEKRRAYRRRVVEQDLVGAMLKRAKKRADAKGLEFSLTRDDLVIPEVCPVFGTPFILGDNDWTYSLDRIDSTKGYIPGNVQVISNKANRIKTNGTASEMQAIAAYMLKERFGLSA